MASSYSPAVTSKPSVEHIGWRLGFGVGVELPQASKIALASPQSAVFSFGASQVVMSGLVPDSLLKKPITTILLGIYAFLTIICLQLPARMLGGTGELAEATKLALSYYAFVGVFASGLAVCSAILFVHALRLEGMLLFAAGGLCLVVTLRGRVGSRFLCHVL